MDPVDSRFLAPSSVYHTGISLSRRVCGKNKMKECPTNES